MNSVACHTLGSKHETRDFRFGIFSQTSDAPLWGPITAGQVWATSEPPVVRPLSIVTMWEGRPAPEEEEEEPTTPVYNISRETCRKNLNPDFVKQVLLHHKARAVKIHQRKTACI